MASRDRYDDQSHSFDVAEAIPHPAYNATLTRYNDIALVRLQQLVELNPYIRPACLPNVRLFNETIAVATGWGAVEHGSPNNDLLLKVKLDIFTHQQCDASYATANGHFLKLPQGVSSETQLCAGSHTDKKDICWGDSGGPLQISHPFEENYCMYIVLGVSSFGQGCNGKGQPSIFTQVFPYVKWIEDTVWPNA